MSATTHDGQIDDSRVYTHKAIARILGTNDRWVKENVLFCDNDACPFNRRGNLYFVSGYHFRLWIERNSDGGVTDAE